MKEKVKVPMMSGYVEFTPGKNDDHLVITPVLVKELKKESVNFSTRPKASVEQKR